jgi:probable phosphoglycerate mutase
VTRIVLIRHGQAQAFVEQTVAGHACKGLSDHGRVQAEQLRERLLRTGELRDASFFYASLMRRAQETAEIIAPGVGDGSLEIRHDCGVCEHHPGEAEGLSWNEFEKAHGGWNRIFERDRPWAPGAESTDELMARIGSALNRLAEDHKRETIVIACHGGVVGGSFEALAGIRFGDLSRYTENTAITEWTRDDDGAWWLVRYNDAAHLS